MDHWLVQAAARAPDRVAIEGPERTLTYAELLAAAGRSARALRSIGARERVGVALPPGEDFVITLHAALLAGLAVVPIDLRLSPQERAARQAGAEVVLEAPLRADGAGPPAPLETASRACRHAHLGHHLRPQADRPERGQLPGQRARIGRRARPAPG